MTSPRCAGFLNAMTTPGAMTTLDSMTILASPRMDPVQVLRAETPLRVWSLIVTIFGDAVMNRGTNPAPAPIWIAGLMDLLDLLGVEAGLARTNLSRLVANGTLLRDKSGRNTFYRLSAASAADFARASGVIYGTLKRAPTGRFHLVAIDRCADRAGARKALEAAGFRFIGASVAVLPEHDGLAAPPLPPGVILAEALSSDALGKAAQDAWQIEALAAGYRRFCPAFAAVTGATPLPPEAAVAWRIVAVHLFRRLALRDPLLPEVVLPVGWSGDVARAVFDRVMAQLSEPSEVWLRQHGYRD